MKRVVTLIGLLTSLSVNAANWTANIKTVTVSPTGKAHAVLENWSRPYPVGSTWNCASNVVLLGDPDNRAVISIARAQSTTQNQVRIGIEGAGSNCYVSYIGV